MLRRTLTLFGLVGATALAACSDAATEPGTTTAVEASAQRTAGRGAPAPGSASIAAVASEAGFSELVGALAYVDAELDAGLVDLFLTGTSQHTVFAPTNEAFERLYGLLGAVLGAEIDEITDIPAPVVLDVLRYHVTPGLRAANSVVPPRGERTITPLLRETFGVRADGSIRDGLTGLRTDASVVTANIPASNGIIHVIDAVIVPPSVVAALTR
jgi:transforming growth factor-beta-induced protein